MCPQKTSHWKGNLGWVKYTKRTQNNITAVTSITSPRFVLIIRRKITQFDTNLNHMIENLHTIMSSFKRIKLLVRQGLPSTLRIRTAESDTDRMFVFPRVHSQHASARSERSCDSTAFPTLFFWVGKWLQQERSCKTGYMYYFRVCWQHSQPILALWTMCMSDSVWSPVGVNGGNQDAWNFIRATLWQTSNLQIKHYTFFFLPSFIYYLNHTLLQQIQKF